MTQIVSPARTRDASVEARRETGRKMDLICLDLTFGQMSGQKNSDRDKKEGHPKRK